MLGAEVQAEQVNLVVARHLLAFVVIHQTAVADFFRIVAGQRDRPTHQPDFVFTRHRGEKFLNRAFAFNFLRGNFVGVFQPHDGEILRQRHQFGTRRHG